MSNKQIIASTTGSLSTKPQKHIRKGHSPIRERCIEYIKALRQHGYINEIPLEPAKEIFSQELGLFDRATIKAYFGCQPGRSIKKIQRLARYASGSMSFKSIELAQETQLKKGYLELLGLATIQKKGQKWFVKLNSEVSIIPETGSHTYENCDSGFVIEKISLSSCNHSSEFEAEGNGERALEENSREGSPNMETRERSQTHTLQGEREKSNNKNQRSTPEQAARDEGFDCNVSGMCAGKASQKFLEIPEKQKFVAE